MLLKQIPEKDFEKIGRLFKTGPGEEVLNVLSETFYNTISFTGADTHTTAFKEGQRDVVQVLRKAVEHIERKEMNDGG